MFSNASNVNQLWSTWQKRFLEIMEICIPKNDFPQKASPLTLSIIAKCNEEEKLCFQIIQMNWLCQ